MSQLTGPAYKHEDYAGFIRRTAALLFDIMLVILASILIGGICISIPSIPWTEEQEDAVLAFVFTMTFLLYMLGFRLSLKGTPGYRLFRIRYAYMLDGKPTALTLLFRSFVAVVLLLFFALDHLWILFDEHKQAWHDKLSGFYVVKRKAQPCGTQRVTQRIINFMMLTFVVWEGAPETHTAATAGAT